MLLSELAEAIHASMNSTPEEWDGGTGVTANLTMDWVTALMHAELQVLIVPQFVEYTAEQSQGRQAFVNFHTTKFISLIVGKGLQSLPDSDDIAPWSETRELLDIRERAEQFIIKNWPARTQLVSIEGGMIDEIQTDFRNFNGVTNFGYEIITNVNRTS